MHEILYSRIQMHLRNTLPLAKTRSKVTIFSHIVFDICPWESSMHTDRALALQKLVVHYLFTIVHKQLFYFLVKKEIKYM